MQWFACNRGRAELEVTTTTTTRSKKMGTTARGPRVGEGGNASKLKLVRAGERTSEEEDDEEGKVNKCWNCTRRKVECVWPR